MVEGRLKGLLDDEPDRRGTETRQDCNHEYRRRRRPCRRRGKPKRASSFFPERGASATAGTMPPPRTSPGPTKAMLVFVSSGRGLFDPHL